MRRGLPSFLTLAVGAAAFAMPASAAFAIDPPTVRVTPQATSVVVGDTRPLTATVANLEDTSVTWSVRSGPGTVSPTGVYTPPATYPADPVAVVRAAATNDPGVYGEATVTIASGVPGGAFGAELPTNTGGGQDADMGDINGDGRTDVVLFQNCCNDLKVGHLVTLTWNGTSLVRGGPGTALSTYQENGFTATNDHLLDIELGDLDGDGDLDVYVPFGSTQAQYWRYQVWRNDGTGTFTPDPRVRTTGGARSGARARLTDFDGDGRLDALRMEWFGTLLFEKGNGDGTFQEPVALMSTFDGDSFDIGDLTGDGRPEIVVGIKGSTNSSTTIEVGINNGFGALAGEVSYTVGMAPEPRIADTNGDGWNDIVVGIGGEHYTFHPPKLLSLTNLANGTGAVGSTPVELLPWRPRSVEVTHVDGDGVPDLAGHTFRGPVLLRRTGPNAYAPLHALSSQSIHHATFGDVTGDGRLDTFVNFDSTSQFWPGAAEAQPAFAIDPTVIRVNATHTATFTASLRNSTVEPKLTWSASRGTFSDSTYTAPATASPSGTPVTVTASLTGATDKATRDITVVNDKFQFTTLGGLDVRHVARDPFTTSTYYAATSGGVYRSTNGGVTFNPVGSTSLTGTNARQVAVVQDPGGVRRVLAVFGSTLFTIQADGGDWTNPGAPANATSVSAVPGTVVWLVAGGVVYRSANGGATWTNLGQTQVSKAEAVDATKAWLVRTAAPRVALAELTESPTPVLTVTARELPVPGAVVQALAVDPQDPTTAWVATNDAAAPLFRSGAGSSWTAVPTPAVVDRLSVGPNSVLAARAGSLAVYKSTDSGAAWHSVNRGFPTSLTAQSVAHLATGLEVVGTTNGLYTPVEQVPPPPPPITGGPSGTTGPGGTNAFTFTFGTVPDAASYLCALDNASWAACTSPKSYSGPLATGMRTFSVVAVDANGNESATATRSWEVDATPPPVPTILSGPTGLVASTTAEFTFELTGDAAGATCSLDGATPTACTSGRSYSSLTQGAHTFAVRSVDAVGNASAPATRSWTVDTTPPVHPWFWSTPASYSPTDTAFFSWQNDAAATYACTLDGAPVTCGSGGVALAGLTEGEHLFAVTARDAAGNTAANSHRWFVDLTDPAPPVLTVKPDVTTSSTSATFAFASPSSDVYYYVCDLDGVSQACYGDMSYSNLSFGNHTFGVHTVDRAGRVSARTDHTWTVSLGPPAITGGPAGLVSSRTATFTFTAHPASTTACSLDGATPAPCTSGITYTGLADGPHTFSVTQSQNGATSPTATREWTVDATAPATPELTAVPAARTASSGATFAWVPDPALTYACRLDGAAVTCGDGAYTATGLPQGAHEFVLTAYDAALNPAMATYGWTVDQTGPVVSLSEKPAARTNLTTARFEFGSAAADVDRYVCTIDGVADECTTPVNLWSLAAGEHTFSVVAYDDLGNAGAPVSHTWTVDATGPVTAFSATPPARTAQTFASFAFSSTAADLHRFTCTLDGVTEACWTSFEEVGLGEGTHTLSVVAYDDLGNAGAPATHTWTVDLTAPSASIVTKPPALSNDSTPTFTFSSPDADLDGFMCELDGVTTPCESPFTPDPLTPGPHQLSVRAVDDVRNVGAPVLHGWTIDLTAPGTTIATPSAALNPSHVVSWSEPVRNVTTGTVRLLVTGTTSAVPAAVSCRTAANAVVACTAPNVQRAVLTPTGILTPGQLYTIQAAGVTDLAGNPAAGTRGYRASTSEQENGLAGRPAWRRAGWTGAQGGSYHVADTRNATASYAFTGTSVTWYGVRGPTYGLADVYVDGVLKASKVNFYSTSTGAITRTIGGLTNAKHTLRIVVRGERGSTSGRGTDVAVDAFKVGTALAASPPVTFAWARNASSAASGGAFMVDDYAGATYTVTFRGRGIDWVTMLGPNMGKATVHIDGVSKGTFDNWASATRYGAVRRFGGLTDKVHTMTITVLGQRRSGATGSNVVVDRFGILP